MKALTLSVLIGMTGFSACSPFGSPPTNLPTPSISPSGNPSLEPSILPTWTPSPTIPIPMVTPTAGGENLQDKSEADIETRRELWTITHALLNPEQSRILYTYSKTLQIDFKNWYRNPANKTIQSGLWAFDPQTGQHREVIVPKDVWGDSRVSAARWLNNQEIVYSDEESNSLIAQNVLTGKTRTVLEEQLINQFEVYQDDLFVLYSKDKKQYLARINLLTQERTEQEIPYVDFYLHAKFGIVTRDQILLGQFKEFYKNTQYPFKVATTTPPPIVDSFLLNVSDGSFLPVEKGLDLNSYESLQVSPNQSYFATQRGSNSQIYTMSGKLILEVPGEYNWLEGNQVLIKEGRKMTHFEIQGETARQLDSFTTQTECYEMQNQSPAVMQCPIYPSYSGNGLQRVFTLSPVMELEATQSLDSYEDSKRSVQLLPAFMSQTVRIVETYPATDGYTSLIKLDAQGKSKVLMRLNNPSKPDFKFDPTDFLWSGSY